ncbi:MAG: carboxypeptidase M32 [Vampirovibrionales bacterium]|nr:carboxypeptidase M32 [Vampirovibrionales bacterium]
MVSQRTQNTVAESSEMLSFRRTIGEIQDLSSIQGLLGWDLETMMPKKGAIIRARQMATLTRLIHEKTTAPELAELLKILEKQSGLDIIPQAMVREFSREYERAAKIPTDLMEEFVQLTAEAHHVWIEAREKKQFSIFQPLLCKIVELNRKIADIVGYEGSPYNALLDEYEVGLTTEQLEPLFASLKTSLISLLKRIQNSKASVDTSFLNRHYEAEKQLQFLKFILTEMGFDFDAGRLDLSAHPFSSGTGYTDVRMTTRVSETDLFSALSSSMHEAGHGMYSQGVNPQLHRTNLSDGTSLGIHESQSRMWENIIGRSHAFWRYYYPKLQGLYHPQLDDVSFDRFYKAINTVQPSFIRVEADEVTYNLHILIRYEIEKAIIEGDLPVSDIPSAWNAKYQEYLGVTPPDDAIGCLQDVHWSHGSFGYFPTYTLGNLYSAQFFQQATLDIPGLEAKIANGDLKTLKRWLNEQIHWVGKSERPAQIVQRVCNEPLNAQYFVDYLEKKYSQIYGL